MSGIPQDTNTGVDLKNYILVTLAYWGFTVTDGALRMLVLLHFHRLGYSPLELAFLFVLYEFCGIVTNLYGGWLAARTGLRVTLYAGLSVQIVALFLLSLLNSEWSTALSVAYVTITQALSGVAKDLTKMSAKSAIKVVVGEAGESKLFYWVALLTGSKNVLKGAGFFLGGVLLGTLGFAAALQAMAAALIIVLFSVVVLLTADMAKAKVKIGLGEVFSSSRAINVLSLARFFLFGARDVWFVVALPIFLYDRLEWSFSLVGAFMAAWVIGYGVVQAVAPKAFPKEMTQSRVLTYTKAWGIVLILVTAILALTQSTELYASQSLLIGLCVFGAIFAVNSSVHSYLILSYSEAEHVTLSVGFYYMANAAGRLIGTLLSGGLYLLGGMQLCLWGATLMLSLAGALLFMLREKTHYYAVRC